MKYILIILIFIFTLNESFGQQKQSEIQTKSSLALRYYGSKDYEKALPLLKEVHQLTRNSTYFKYYINCLLELDRSNEAITEIQSEIRKQRTPRPDLYINWGYVLKKQGKSEESELKYKEAISKIPANKSQYLISANTFTTWGEYEWAKQTYLKGKQVLVGEMFNYELARSYMYLRDYESMMEEYLDLVKNDEKQLPRVQSSLSSAMRLDIDDGLRNGFRGQVLRRIQAEPYVTGYNRLLIWFFLQEKKFGSALRQSVALDRRTGEEAAQIAQLGNMAILNKEFGEAVKAYDYLLGKGKENPFFAQAFSLKVHAQYMEFITGNGDDREKAEDLAQQFNDALEYLGYNPATLDLIREYAHLQAFYLNETDTAIAVLEKGLKITRLKPQQSGLLKTEMADIYVYADDPWEAMLIYSQVIDANKRNTLGDEVKLKKAQLGYYMGNFSWAKAQLDVLKASTSKLTANDAMALSMLIGNNLNLDTTAVPLQMFARADLLFFQNHPVKAMQVLDSLAELYPYHSLVDDILFRKAKVEVEARNYALAAEYLETIVADFSYELLGDDALFMLAEIKNYNLDQKEQAKELYKQLLTNHPGSVFIEESRANYRALREIYPDKEPEGVDGLFERAIDNTEF